MRGGARFRLNLDLLGAIIEQADANVIKAEVLLDFSHNLAQHVHRIVARNGGARNIVEECQLPGTPLLLCEQPGVLHRNRYLAGGGHQNIKVALFEYEFPFGAHGDHNARRLVAEQDGHRTHALGGMLGPVGDAQAGPRLLQFGPYQQRLPRPDHIFGECVFQLARPLGQNTIVLDFQLKADLIPFLEGNVEVAGVENLSQLGMDGAEHFILIQPGANGLADLGE